MTKFNSSKVSCPAVRTRRLIAGLALALALPLSALGFSHAASADDLGSTTATSAQVSTADTSTDTSSAALAFDDPTIVADETQLAVGQFDQLQATDPTAADQSDPTIDAETLEAVDQISDSNSPAIVTTEDPDADADSAQAVAQMTDPNTRQSNKNTQTDPNVDTETAQAVAQLLNAQ